MQEITKQVAIAKTQQQSHHPIGKFKISGNTSRLGLAPRQCF